MYMHKHTPVNKFWEGKNFTGWILIRSQLTFKNEPITCSLIMRGCVDHHFAIFAHVIFSSAQRGQHLTASKMTENLLPKPAWWLQEDKDGNIFVHLNGGRLKGKSGKDFQQIAAISSGRTADELKVRTSPQSWILRSHLHHGSFSLRVPSGAHKRDQAWPRTQGSESKQIKLNKKISSTVNYWQTTVRSRFPSLYCRSPSLKFS